MTSRRDTQRAVEILARYQGSLQSPAERLLQVSIEKVVHVFQSELFQALLDIQECYELNLLSACKQDGDVDLENVGDASKEGYLENHDHNRYGLQGKLQGREAWSQDSGQVLRLVKVKESRTELLAQVCSLVVGVCSTLPKKPPS
nr:disks large 1 tumor suppressor protein-like isoform X2 [Zootoca vivipara]